jgi:hypothetical protein
MPNSTSTLERAAATSTPDGPARAVNSVYSREQQEQLLILQAEVELLLIQIQAQAAQTTAAA